MSSRAVVTVVCDFCASQQAPEAFASETFVVKINGDPARQIDLCDEHANDIAGLRAIVRSRGASPGTTSVGTTPCPICGQECKGGTGLAAHTRARHGS